MKIFKVVLGLSVAALIGACAHTDHKDTPVAAADAKMQRAPAASLDSCKAAIKSACGRRLANEASDRVDNLDYSATCKQVSLSMSSRRLMTSNIVSNTRSPMTRPTIRCLTSAAGCCTSALLKRSKPFIASGWKTITPILPTTMVRAAIPPRPSSTCAWRVHRRWIAEHMPKRLRMWSLL